MRVWLTSQAQVQLQDLNPAQVRRIMRTLRQEARKTRRAHRRRRIDPSITKLYVPSLAVLTVYRSRRVVLLLSIHRLPS